MEGIVPVNALSYRKSPVRAVRQPKEEGKEPRNLGLVSVRDIKLVKDPSFGGIVPKILLSISIPMGTFVIIEQVKPVQTTSPVQGGVAGWPSVPQDQIDSIDSISVAATSEHSGSS